MRGARGASLLNAMCVLAATALDGGGRWPVATRDRPFARGSARSRAARARKARGRGRRAERC